MNYVFKSKQKELRVVAKAYMGWMGNVMLDFGFKDGTLLVIDPPVGLIQNLKDHPKYGDLFWLEGDGPEDDFTQAELRSMRKWVNIPSNDARHGDFAGFVKPAKFEETFLKLVDRYERNLQRFAAQAEKVELLEDKLDLAELDLQQWENWYAESPMTDDVVAEIVDAPRDEEES
jgi:hypothetical protein